MRILLDQNTPLGVRHILATHDVRTAFQMGWARLSNSNLLDAAEQAGFEAFVTCDQNMVFQQSLARRNIAVVVLSTNYWPTIRSQPQRLPHAIANASPGSFSVATFGRQRRSRPAPDLKC
jgi:hypothetical protein